MDATNLDYICLCHRSILSLETSGYSAYLQACRGHPLRNIYLSLPLERPHVRPRYTYLTCRSHHSLPNSIYRYTYDSWERMGHRQNFAYLPWLRIHHLRNGLRLYNSLSLLLIDALPSAQIADLGHSLYDFSLPTVLHRSKCLQYSSSTERAIEMYLRQQCWSTETVHRSQSKNSKLDYAAHPALLLLYNRGQWTYSFPWTRT